jgi:hypothetical protein
MTPMAASANGTPTATPTIAFVLRDFDAVALPSLCAGDAIVDEVEPESIAVVDGRPDGALYFVSSVIQSISLRKAWFIERR